MAAIRWTKDSILGFINSHIVDYPTPINLNYFWKGSRSYCGGPFSPIDDKKSIDSKKSIKTETSRFPGAEPKMAKKILIEKFDIKNGTGYFKSVFQGTHCYCNRYGNLNKNWSIRLASSESNAPTRYATT